MAASTHALEVSRDSQLSGEHFSLGESAADMDPADPCFPPIQWRRGGMGLALESLVRIKQRGSPGGARPHI